jgi:DNA-binding response OmpR family regulator
VGNTRLAPLKTILIVEDQEEVRESHVFHLQWSGYCAIGLESGAKAIGLLASAVPDLLVVDLHLPRVSGLDILTVVRASKGTEHIPVVLLTRAGIEHHAVQGDPQPDLVLQQPVDPKELLVHIERLLKDE